MELFYWRGKRLSLYVSTERIWLRLRDAHGDCGPFFLSVGREVV